MALAVCMSGGGGQDGRDDTGDAASCNGCPVILQPKKLVQFGRANQRWHFDHSTGLIRAFHTNQLDKGMCWFHWGNLRTGVPRCLPWKGLLLCITLTVHHQVISECINLQ